MPPNIALSAIIVVIVVTALVIIAAVIARRRAQSDGAPLANGDDGPSWFDDDANARVVERDPPIRWTDQVGAQAAVFNDDARLRLIADLGLIRAAWVVPVLRQAYTQEHLASHRRAVLLALAACRNVDAAPTFELAALSSDEQERAIATAALRAEPREQEQTI